MRAIGISPLDKDATVSFLEDGVVRFACAEERLSRVKLQSGFPYRALELGLQTLAWAPTSVDVVCYGFYDATEESRRIHQSLERSLSRSSLFEMREAIRCVRSACRNYRVDRSTLIPGLKTERDEFVPPKPLLKRMMYRAATRTAPGNALAQRHFLADWERIATADHRLRSQQLAEGLAKYEWTSKLRRFRHHKTHAANSFFASGFDEALVVTFDGYGSGNAGAVYRGGPNGIELLHEFPFPNSLGQFYEEVTSGLGFTPSRHEGKIVGLAAYGNPEILKETLLKRFEFKDGDFSIRCSHNYYWARALVQQFAKRDVAAAYQRVLEEVGTRIVAWWAERTGLRRCVVSGGVHANVKFNQRIHELPAVDEIFVYPNMGDGGCATGAAMLAYSAAELRGHALRNAYLGPQYSSREIEQELRRSELEYEHVPDVEERIAALLASNHIVGRFHGRMEYGPRALGNRSILYPAQEPEVNQWLNHQLGRTEFMPFAPAVLAEEASRLFLNLRGCERTAEFMTITLDCTDFMKRTCPAAVHVDGTARPQLVRAETNPSFHRVLQSYHRRTGVPAVINTSFNMHEEPIVCSPKDAIRAFLLGNIDYLAIESFIVPHPRLGDRLQGDRRRTLAGEASG